MHGSVVGCNIKTSFCDILGKLRAERGCLHQLLEW